MSESAATAPASSAPPHLSVSAGHLFRGDWKTRLDQVVAMMREMSLQNDPQIMVQRYAARVKQLLPNDGLVAVSRRGLIAPKYKITRSHVWGIERNPWKNPNEFPALDKGILGEWLYKGSALIIDDLRVDPGDPAFAHLDGFRSAMALPNYDEGVVKHITVILKREPNYFPREHLPEQVWMSNLFGRMTLNLVLRDQLRRAYEAVDKELKTVGDIQRSLLPEKIPEIPGLQLAAHYLTSRRAGGDYYDFFPLADGRWGIFVADVSGHGTPAAVLMAVTHSIAHTVPGEPDPPSKLMSHVNRTLARFYTGGNGTFVTGFYGIFDPKTRKLRYSSAGHPRPRLKRASGEIVEINASSGLPLGIDPDETFSDEQILLRSGDVLVIYTDGITESRQPGGDLFGTERLDGVLAAADGEVEHTIRNILLTVEEFTDSAAPEDDQTLIVARVT
jgi:phosphoserine phosphatase RsbU/P